MKSKEMFDSLRVTTMEVAAPLIHLAVHRSEMIKEFIAFLKTQEMTPEVARMVERYNRYAVRDQELVAVAQGKASEELL